MVRGEMEVKARADLVLFAVGAVLVGIGEALPYAILRSGGVTNPAPLQLVLLVACGVAFLLARRRRLAWLAMGVSAAIVVFAGYLAVGALRAVSTWSAVWYEADGEPGPSTVVMATGIVVCAAAVFVRALVMRPSGRTTNTTAP
jgi:hypothetical protein